MLLSTRSLTHSVCNPTTTPSLRLCQNAQRQNARSRLLFKAAASSRNDSTDSLSRIDRSFFAELKEASKQSQLRLSAELEEMKKKADMGMDVSKDYYELVMRQSDKMDAYDEEYLAIWKRHRKDWKAALEKEEEKELKAEKKEKKDMEAKAEKDKQEEKELKAEKKEKKKEEKELKAEKKEKTEAKAEKDKMEEPKKTPEAKALKEERKRLMKEAEARGALYALHWVVAPKKVAQEAEAACNTMAAATASGVAGDPTAPAKQFISSLQMDLERAEKVAKDAVWYLTREAEDGLHVVLVTANVKHASKHELAELTGAADTHLLSLGAAGEVEVPVATLRRLVLAQREESSDSDSEGEEEKLRKGDSKEGSKAGLLAQLGGIHVEGDVDAAIAAALASIGSTGASNELDFDTGAQYPPFRSFL